MHKGLFKYEATKQKILEYIKTAPIEEPLPNRNALTRQFNVARVTLERAISELIGEGVLVSIDGCGTFISKDFDPNALANPSAYASQKQASHSKCWALLTYSVTKGITPQILRGVEDFANKHDISLIVCNTDNDPQKESKYLQRLIEQGVSGIVLIPSIHAIPNRQILDTIKESRVPLVACSRQISGHDFPGAFQNFFHAGYMATQHLLDQGCRNIAYLATARYCSVEDRLQGYLAALQQHNMRHASDPAHEAYGIGRDDGEIEMVFENFISNHPEIDGLYLFSDRLAEPVYAVLRRRKIKAGKDIRLIATEDSGFCSNFWVPLSTIDFPAYDMGMIAAEQLYLLLNGANESTLKREILSGTLNIRASSI